MSKFLAAIPVLTAALMICGMASAQQTETPKPGTTAGTTAGTSSATTSSQSSAFKTDKDKTSYALGMNIGQSLKKDSLDVDPNLVIQGLKDAMSGSKSLLSEAEMQEAMTQLRNQVVAKKQADMQKAGETNKAAGEKFLAANKTKEGVVTLPSGLQYKILKEGTGPKPTASETVVCNYRGTLVDGTEFDSSYGKEPVTFGVGQVIKGWTEALQLMPVGSKWQLYIPSELAYGANGAGGGVIPPNATLIFDVELISIKGK